MFSVILSAVDGIGNGVLNFAQDKSNFLVSFLPVSPFKRAINLIGNIPYMNEIMWFIPIQEMVLILMWWGTAIGVYYAYMVVLRWVKAIA